MNKPHLDCGVLKRQLQKATPFGAALKNTLAAQAETLDQVRITRLIFFLHVVEETTTLTNHFQQATAGVIVFAMIFKMFSQIRDALCQNRNLYFG